jgi:hypothetical protein
LRFEDYIEKLFHLQGWKDEANYKLVMLDFRKEDGFPVKNVKTRVNGSVKTP